MPKMRNPVATWEDRTSYMKNESRVPKTWELRVGSLRIVVTRHRDFSPDTWILICDPWFQQYPISKGTAEEAQRVAAQKIWDKLQAELAELSQVKDL